ncbi:MAG: TspO/MBR family protein [Acetobacteraceae bacterium]
MEPVTAALLAGGVVLGAALLARRWGPEPTHRETENWYAILEKPPYAPPGGVIGAVWATLDVLLAVAGARLLAAPASRARCRALAGWSVAVAGIPGWMAVFFGARCIPGGLGVIGVMLGAAATTVTEARRVDRVAARAIAPLVGWLGFAGLLNAEIWRRNR